MKTQREVETIAGDMLVDYLQACEAMGPHDISLALSKMIGLSLAIIEESYDNATAMMVLSAAQTVLQQHADPTGGTHVH